jgi:hypothetical protein
MHASSRGDASLQARAGRQGVRRTAMAALVIAVSTIAWACGGSTSTSTGTAAPPAAPATDGVIASQAAPAAPVTSEAGNAGTFSGSACELLTTAEVEAATGQTGVEAQPTAAGDFDGESQCAFVANGVLPVIIVTVTGPNTNTDPSGYLALPESARLSLNGADGVWVPAAGFVAMVIKHGLVVAVQVAGPAEGHEFLDVAAAVAQPVADRMP